MNADEDDGWSSVVTRKGHFRLESGLHAATWLELDALFVEPKRLKPQVDALAALVAAHAPTAICGPMLGGAFVAQHVAMAMGLRFYFTQRVEVARDDGLFNAVYCLPDALRAMAAKERFAIVDDVVGAGSSVRATHAELVGAGAEVVAIGALMVMGTRATEHFASRSIPLVAPRFVPFETWQPSQCPQCAAGIASIEP